jgi:hypothetical protein
MASLSNAKSHMQKVMVSRLAAAAQRPRPRALAAAVSVLLAAAGLALASYQYLEWKVVYMQHY